MLKSYEHSVERERLKKNAPFTITNRLYFEVRLAKSQKFLNRKIENICFRNKDRTWKSEAFMNLFNLVLKAIQPESNLRRKINTIYNVFHRGMVKFHQTYNNVYPYSCIYASTIPNMICSIDTPPKKKNKKSEQIFFPVYICICIFELII